MSKKILSNKPPKGTVDWFPEEYKIRKYIFDTWRKVCVRFGYEEYLTPLVEMADVYRAKSGEDVGGAELMTFFDRAGRELSIRPEMTPSVTRMVSQVYEASPKPIRYFSIANFMRNEKPQRGRNREFWQLNFDCFGSNSINADIEIVQMGLEIMIELGAPQKSFVLYLNNRKLINDVLEIAKVKKGDKVDVARILDKKDKLKESEFVSLLKMVLDDKQVEKLLKYTSSKNVNDLVKNLPEIKNSNGLAEIAQVIGVLEDMGYKDWIQFNPSIIRGFDYYDGLVFEVFDKSPKNTRALFGGGRYNGLAGIFGAKPFPAVGCAPGDEAIRLFLEEWGLLGKIAEKIKEEIFYIPLLEEGLIDGVQKIAKKLRSERKNVELGLEVQKMGKALTYANKKKIGKVVIFGSDEAKKGACKIKDMETGKETRLVV